MRFRLPLLIAFLLALTLPATAAADDASVKAAWDSQDAQLQELGQKVRREAKRWSDRGFTRDGRLLRLMRQAEGLMRVVAERVTAEQSSTPKGEEAKVMALRAVETSIAANRASRTLVRVAQRRVTRRARRAAARAERLGKRARDEAQQALELFRQAGVA